MCKVLSVSESGYYRHLQPSKGSGRREHLLVEIKRILGEYPDNHNYGINRIYLALQQRGEKTSYATVYRIMRENNLVKKAKRHPNGITREDAAVQKAENLIQQDFTAKAPNKKWLTDITEVPCYDGKLHIAPILDCFDGKIVGLAMDDNMRKELCIQAFESACRHTGARSMILHSDRGSQFTSGDFRDILSKYQAHQSMSGTGRCYDNARMESFFATLKKEKLYQINTRLLTIRQVKTIVFRYIFIYYNQQRVYSSNPGGYPPDCFRKMHFRNAA